MKLTYRGTAYDYTPAALDMVDSELTGMYRGQAIRFSYPKHIPVAQTAANLSYRGVSYQRSASGVVTSLPHGVDAQSAMAPAAESQSLIPSRARRSTFTEVARVHHENIMRNLQHRLDVARAKGDETLIRALEREMQTFA